MVLSNTLLAQETVFSFLKPDDRKADEFYKSKNYQQAINLYKSLDARNSNGQNELAIARSYYYLHKPEEAAKWYDKYATSSDAMPAKDLFLYAESLSALQRYDEAIAYYSRYEALATDDHVVMKKIWQLKNRSFLFEDSMHYSLTQLNINSTASDICPVVYGGGFVFLSNRERLSMIDKVDANNDPFFRLYRSRMIEDTLHNEMQFKFDGPERFGSELNQRYQQGPVSFYGEQKRMAFIASDPGPSHNEKRSLQMFFAELENQSWVVKNAFPFNDAKSSITAVCVQENGSLLYFASDRPGGRGGQDLYSSSFRDGQWTQPENLGEHINTSGDESFPSLSGRNLYFSSNGLAGLGGLDIFKSPIGEKGLGEAVNIGYPVNTSFDDFGISLYEDGSRGFLSSNRHGTADDVFEVTIDLQSYPFTITGLLKFKEESWRDSSELKILPNAQLLLIDNQKNAVVQTSTSDVNGSFELTIPYFSQYRIKIKGDEEMEETVVSLDLGRTRSGNNQYEVVVVKNTFKKTY
ncbi:MAG TPA: hypothetical protein VK666_01695 [Chryseolinea sp.]|nr:hypothetical protein [Chryseolinea sp.]